MQVAIVAYLMTIGICVCDLDFSTVIFSYAHSVLLYDLRLFFCRFVEINLIINIK